MPRFLTAFGLCQQEMGCGVWALAGEDLIPGWNYPGVDAAAVWMEGCCVAEEVLE